MRVGGYYLNVSAPYVSPEFVRQPFSNNGHPLVRLPVVALFTPTRMEGSATLVAALNEMPRHEEKRKQLSSMLQHTEQHTRSEIAEAARSAAELRCSSVPTRVLATDTDWRWRDTGALSLAHCFANVTN